MSSSPFRPSTRRRPTSTATTPPPLNHNDLEARQGQRTPFDQLRVDPNVGENPNLHYISGTGAHDIINVLKVDGNRAIVTVEAFDDSKYKKPIRVPGTSVVF